LDTDNGKTGRNDGIQVIARAAKILYTLKDHPNGLSLGQIAQLVGLPRSTVQRIVLALEKEGLIMHASPSVGFRLGPGLMVLAAAVHFDLRREVHPFLEELSKEIEETVDLAVPDRGRMLFIDQIPAPHRLRAVSAVGVHSPMHCTANGKAILAALPLDEAKKILYEMPLNAYTPYTITDPEKLLKELEEIRRVGVAYDREEFTEEICAVGATIRDSGGRLAAISVPLPASRFYGNEEKLAEALIRTCRKIEAHLMPEASLMRTR